MSGAASGLAAVPVAVRAWALEGDLTGKNAKRREHEERKRKNRHCEALLAAAVPSGPDPDPLRREPRGALRREVDEARMGLPRGQRVRNRWRMQRRAARNDGSSGE